MINRKRKENKLWDGFIRMADRFKYARGIMDINGKEIIGSEYELRDEFNNMRYKAIIWYETDNLCSIHGTANNIILNIYNRKKSREMAIRLMGEEAYYLHL